MLDQDNCAFQSQPYIIGVKLFWNYFPFAVLAFFALFASEPPGRPILTLVGPLPAPPVTVILPYVYASVEVLVAVAVLVAVDVLLEGFVGVFLLLVVTIICFLNFCVIILYINIRRKQDSNL